MPGQEKILPKRYSKKSDERMKKYHVYASAASKSMDDAYNFDTAVLEANDTYLEKLQEADKVEYDILMDNMQKATTEEERREIRQRMAEMRKERYAKDTENKAFYEKQQEDHRNHNLKILASVAVVTGLAYKYRKPIMEIGQKVLLKK